MCSVERERKAATEQAAVSWEAELSEGLAAKFRGDEEGEERGEGEEEERGGGGGGERRRRRGGEEEGDEVTRD